MNFHFPNYSITLDELLAGKINQNFTDTENYILKYVQKWMDGSREFEFQTSGSTGNPKSIVLFHNQLAYSAKSTLTFLFPSTLPETLLLCLNPHFIGGTQVITRALATKADLIFQEPTSNPLKTLSGRADLVSMVPLQVESTLADDPLLFEKVGTVLIGGAPLSPSTSQKLMGLKTRFFETYGMTETASNIALRKVGEIAYSFIGDIEHRIDKRGCLAIKGTVTNDNWIQTNDIVSFDQEGFNILGRADWVINTGGIKVNPEQLERVINEKIKGANAYITSVSDENLGQKVILCSTKPVLDLVKDLKLLEKYERPKGELILDEFPMTPSGKIDRIELQKLAERSF